jgi:hypothetical protein
MTPEYEAARLESKNVAATKATAGTMLTLLQGWTDSEFASAASGEFCEDLKAMLEEALSRPNDGGYGRALADAKARLESVAQWTADGVCAVESCVKAIEALAQEQ